MTRRLLISLLILPQLALAAPIYVIKNKDGSITFTTRTPPSGAQATVFTSKGARFSYYKGWAGPRRMGPLNREAFKEIVTKVSKRHAVDPALVRAVIHAESAFNPKAISPKGAKGLMQLMPGTARDLGVKKPFDPEQNISGGVRYLASMLKRYDRSIKLALAAYNAGPDWVDKYRAVPPFSETQNYVSYVQRLYKEYAKSPA